MVFQFIILIPFFRLIARKVRNHEFGILTTLVVMVILIGTWFYHHFEHWRYLDAMYFSVTTLTTVGLGDISPKTDIGKIFTMVYIVMGMGIILGFVNAIAHHINKRNPVKRFIKKSAP